MAQINLLPWRDKIRKEKQQQFFILLGLMVSLTAVAMFAVHMFQEDRISYQEKRLAYVDSQIKHLDRRIREIKVIEYTRRSLEKRIKKVRDLERNRAEVVHLFHELVTRLPQAVHLTNISQSKRKITLKGVAADNKNVSDYIRHLESSVWLNRLDIGIVTHQHSKAGSARLSHFTITAEQNQPELLKSKKNAGYSRK
ncbi:hypothetical protein MNBD_GAMMA12-3387 [hydrothermal vent metagenome]|uniref:Type IV pilus biogenesis protein PilN n=1 Tax=hydrothermal vent metagenome TaxID=652676 RepID=A0A3B0YGJ1_9ZZZZ